MNTELAKYETDAESVFKTFAPVYVEKLSGISKRILENPLQTFEELQQVMQELQQIGYEIQIMMQFVNNLRALT